MTIARIYSSGREIENIEFELQEWMYYTSSELEPKLKQLESLTLAIDYIKNEINDIIIIKKRHE